jgi:hypothetical protein
LSRWAFKRGDTFNLAGDASLLVDGEVLSFAGVEILANVAKDDGVAGDDGAPNASIVGAWLDESIGTYQLLVAQEDTAAWPLGNALIDVAITWPDGRRLTTPTVLFSIVPRVPATA